MGREREAFLQRRRADDDRWTRVSRKSFFLTLARVRRSHGLEMCETDFMHPSYISELNSLWPGLREQSWRNGHIRTPLRRACLDSCLRRVRPDSVSLDDSFTLL